VLACMHPTGATDFRSRQREQPRPPQEVRMVATGSQVFSPSCRISATARLSQSPPAQPTSLSTWVLRASIPPTMMVVASAATGAFLPHFKVHLIPTRKAQSHLELSRLRMLSSIANSCVIVILLSSWRPRMKSCQVIPSFSFADPHTVVVVKHRSSSAGRVLPQRSVQAVTVRDPVSRLSGPS